MTDAPRIPVVLYSDGSVDARSLGRVARFASLVHIVGPDSDEPTVRAAVGVAGTSVRVADLKIDDLGDAIEYAGSVGAAVVVTGQPADPADWLRRNLHGVARAADHGVASVAVYVLGAPRVPHGPIVVASQSGEISGYEPLFAAGFAQRLGLNVEVLSPWRHVQEPRTDVLVQAEELARAGNVSWRAQRVDDPVATIGRRRDEISAVVLGVLDISGGKTLLPRTAIPAKAIAEGGPAAVVEVLAQNPSYDVVVIFDTVRLLYGPIAAAKIAAGVGLALIAGNAVAGAVMTSAPASAAELPTTSAAASQITTTPSGLTYTVNASDRVDVVVTDAGVRITNHSGVDAVIELTLGSEAQGHPTVGQLTENVQAGAQIDLPASAVPAWASLPAPHAVHNPEHELAYEGGGRRINELKITYVAGDGTPVASHSYAAHGGRLIHLSSKDIAQSLNVPLPGYPTPNKAPVSHTPSDPPPLKVPGQVPQAVPQATPGAVPNQVPQATPGAVPNQVPGQVPQAVPQATPGAVPNQVPQATPGAVPNQVPGQVPQAVPQGIPGAIPDLVPHASDMLVPPLATQPSHPSSTQTPSAGPKRLAGESGHSAEQRLAITGGDEREGILAAIVGTVLVGGGVIAVAAGRRREEDEESPAATDASQD